MTIITFAILSLSLTRYILLFEILTSQGAHWTPCEFLDCFIQQRNEQATCTLQLQQRQVQDLAL